MSIIQAKSMLKTYVSLCYRTKYVVVCKALKMALKCYKYDQIFLKVSKINSWLDSEWI